MTESPAVSLGRSCALGGNAEPWLWLRPAFECARTLVRAGSSGELPTHALSAFLAAQFAAAWIGYGRLLKPKSSGMLDVCWSHEQGIRPDWFLTEIRHRFGADSKVRVVVGTTHTRVGKAGSDRRTDPTLRPLLLARTGSSPRSPDAELWAMALTPQTSPADLTSLAPVFAECVHNGTELISLLNASNSRSTATASAHAASMAAPEGFCLLTDAQRNLLPLLAAGHSEREIALRTFRSVHTVRSHVKAIYARLGVRSRLSLALLISGSQAAADVQSRR